MRSRSVLVGRGKDAPASEERALARWEGGQTASFTSRSRSCEGDDNALQSGIVPALQVEFDRKKELSDPMLAQIGDWGKREHTGADRREGKGVK
jgi:hypothetical protein